MSAPRWLLWLGQPRWGVCCVQGGQPSTADLLLPTLDRVSDILALPFLPRDAQL